MQKLNFTVALFLLFASPAIAVDLKGSQVTIASSGFDGNLSPSDNTAQKVAQKVDDLEAGSGEDPLTFNAPLSRTEDAVSLSAANGSQPGYLSASDWNAFNAKLDAIFGRASGVIKPATNGDYLETRDAGGTKYSRWGHDGTDIRFLSDGTGVYRFDLPVVFAGSSSEMGPGDNDYYFNFDDPNKLLIAATGFGELTLDVKTEAGTAIFDTNAGDGAIEKFRFGFGKLTLGKVGQSGVLDFYNTTTAHTTRFQVSASQAQDNTFTLPINDGTTGQALITNGSGVLSFASPSSLASMKYVEIGESIQTAHDNASAGDTLVLAAGTYTVTARINITKSITIRGQGQDRTTISTTTGADYPLNITASNVTIADLSVTGSGNTVLNGLYFDGRAGTVLTGNKVVNVRVSIPSGNNAKVGMEFHDASAVIINPYVSVTSGNGAAYGIATTNYSTAEAATLVQVFNPYVSAVGGTSNDTGAALMANDSSATQDAVLEIYGGQGIGSEQDGAVNKGYAVNSLAGANAVIRVYGTTLNGADADLVADAGTAITTYNVNAVHNTFGGAGTWTRSGTTAAADVTATGTIKGTSTTNIGWTLVDGTDNTTGDAQCTTACVFGIQDATGTAITGIVACNDATADKAYCAG